MLMSPSQAPAHITRDLGDEDDAPVTLQALVLPGPSTPSLRPASLQHLLVGSPQIPQASALPGPAQAPRGPRLPSIDSLPLSSGSLVLPPLSTLLLLVAELYLFFHSPAQRALEFTPRDSPTTTGASFASPPCAFAGQDGRVGPTHRPAALLELHQSFRTGEYALTLM